MIDVSCHVYVNCYILWIVVSVNFCCSIMHSACTVCLRITTSYSSTTVCVRRDHQFVSLHVWSDGITSNPIYCIFLRDHHLMSAPRDYQFRCVPSGTQYYYFMVPHNGKFTDHLAGQVMGPLLDIFLYLPFSIFNISCKGRGNGKLAG